MKKDLFKTIAQRLEHLASLPVCKSDKNLDAELSAKGFDRRDFMKWAGVMTSALALPSSFIPLTAKAAEVANRLPVIWLHMAECTGCSESLLRTEDPSIDSILY